MFENEGRYRRLFGEDTHVKNLLFVYRLGNAVAIAKSRLREKVVSETATHDEKSKFEYFRYGAFAFAVMYVCAEVLGLWLAPQDARYKHRVSFEDGILFDQARSEELLSQLVDTVLGPIHMYLSDKDAYQILKTQAGVDGAATHARTIVEQVHQMMPQTYSAYTESLILLEAAS